MGTAKFRCVIGLCQISWLPRPCRTKVNEFADCNFNVKRTARHLDLHTNTVYFRLNRIREPTGIDPRSYAGLSLLLTTIRMLNEGAREGTVRR